MNNLLKDAELVDSSTDDDGVITQKWEVQDPDVFLVTITFATQERADLFQQEQQKN